MRTRAYCTQLRNTHYKVLEESPAPYFCYLCTQLKQAAAIEEMRGTIACLTAKMVELCAALEYQKPTNSTQTMNSNKEDGRPWSEVVQRGTDLNPEIREDRRGHIKPMVIA